MDRVIYNRAVYAPDIFSGYLLEWGDDAALWQAVCTDDNRAPFFCKLGGQDIYYGIPSSRLMSSKTGTVFFRIDSDWLEEKFSFWSNTTAIRCLCWTMTTAGSACTATMT